jgi:hypothetical protein
MCSPFPGAVGNEARADSIRSYGRRPEGRLYKIDHSRIAVLQWFAAEKDTARLKEGSGQENGRSIYTGGCMPRAHVPHDQSAAGKRSGGRLSAERRKHKTES